MNKATQYGAEVICNRIKISNFKSQFPRRKELPIFVRYAKGLMAFMQWIAVAPLWPCSLKDTPLDLVFMMLPLAVSEVVHLPNSPTNKPINLENLSPAVPFSVNRQCYLKFYF